MADVGNLLIDLRLNSAKFVQGINRVNRRMDQFARHANSARTAVRGLFVAAVGGGFAAFLKEQAVAGDVLAKNADALRDSTERLAAFQLAASELSGVVGEASTKGLERFIVRLGEARQGSGEAIGALKRLGLEAESLSEKTPTQAFEIVGQELAKVPNSAERAEIAYRLLGRQGVALLNTLLRLGEEGLKPFEDIAKDLGVAIDRVSAAKLEQANDQLARASLLVQGTGRNIAIELAPFIQAAAESFAAMGAQGGGAGNLILEGMAIAAKGVGFLANGFKVISVAVQGLIALASSFAEIWVNVASKIDRALRIVVQGITPVFNTLVSNLVTTIDAILVKVQTIAGSLANADFLPDALQAKAAAFVETIGGARAAVEGLGEDLQFGEIADQGAAIENLKKSVTEFAEGRREAFNQALSELLTGKLPSQQIDEFIEQIRQRAAEISEETIEQFGKPIIPEVSDDAGEGIKDLIRSSIKAGADEGAKGMAASLVSAVQDNAIEQIAKILSDGISSIFSSGDGGSGGGGGIGGFFKGLFGFASGGSFTVGNGPRSFAGIDSQLVAFKAKPGENVTVTPAGQSSMGGGNSPTFVTNIDARGAGQGVRQELQSELDLRDRRLLAQVQDMRRRGRL